MDETYVLYHFTTIGNNRTDWEEAIEIGAYKLKRDINGTFSMVGDYYSLIRPYGHVPEAWKMTLANIDGEELLNAPSYPEIITDFVCWAGRNSVFVSWSGTDLKNLFQNNEQNWIDDFPRIKIMDLQQEFDRRHKKSLKDAVAETGNTYYRGSSELPIMNRVCNMVTVFKSLWDVPISISEQDLVVEGEFMETVVTYSSLQTEKKSEKSHKFGKGEEVLRFLRAEREQRLAGAF